MGQVDDAIHLVETTADVRERALRAGELVAEFQSGVNELSRIRREALQQMLADGMNQAEIAKSLDMTRARISQLLAAGPRPARALLGSGALTIAVGAKAEAGRADDLTTHIVSTEAFAAYEVLSDLARSLKMEAAYETVPPPGLVDLNRPNLVVLCSPRLLPFVGQVLASDKVLGFDHDDRGWFLVDRESGMQLRSPSDSGEPRDFAYIGRLPRPDGRGSFLYLAGIHASGTLGAAQFLAENLDDLYQSVKKNRFSLLVACTYDPETRKVIETERITPIHRHESV